MKRVGLIGARGYTGAELIALLAGHPELDLVAASSRNLVGAKVADHVSAFEGELRFETLSPESAAERALDAYVLALPNGLSAPWVDAIDAASPGSVIVDLSADHRFADAWVYGQPERLRASVAGARRIANPGCYATAMQLAIAPMVDALDGPAFVSGVSGFSGAGTTPSPKNDPEVLRDNLLPYGLVGHTHEREVTHQLGHRVLFTPHVAPWFRGIVCTVTLTLSRALALEAIVARYRAAYEREPLVRLQDEPPLVRDIANAHHVAIGGVTLAEDGRRMAVVATIDNLLKGAATQALQNLNLALGLAELAGVPT